MSKRGKDLRHARRTRRIDHLERDSNGVPFEHVWLGGQEVVIRYEDIPESDITEVDGFRVTTALRTVIDIAPDVAHEHLDEILADCLRRGLFTVEEAWERISKPDLADRKGAELLRQLLSLLSQWPGKTGCCAPVVHVPRLKPSSRHLDCPACRGQASKDRCRCGQRKQRTSATCHACQSTVGTSNGNWRGGRTVHKAGYVMRWVPGHPQANPKSPYVFEHILVMEETLGHYLNESENVHHRNGVKDDNRSENLELWTRPQPAGVRATDAVGWATEILARYGDAALFKTDS